MIVNYQCFASNALAKHVENIVNNKNIIDMKTKNDRMKLATLVVATLIVLGFASCSDSTFTSQLEIGGNVLTDGVVSEIDGKLTSIDITSNDSWTIDVPSSASKWIGVSATSGKGNSRVFINIDPNFGSSEGRSATLTVKAGDVVRNINVSQIPSYQGEPLTNDLENPIEIAALKGVGLGFNLNTLRTLKSNVININAIKKLKELDPIKYGGWFEYNTEAETKAQGAVVDSVETKKDSLGISLSFDINYGKFKLNIGGAYHGDETKEHYKDEYLYGGKYKAADTRIIIADVIASYNKAMTTEIDENADEKTKEELALRRMLLTEGFVEAKSMVEEAEKENDNEELEYAIDELISTYGTVIISGCDLGGQLSLQMKYDFDSMKELLHVDSAHVTMSIQTGLLKIGGNVEVGYKNDGLTILNNSAFKYSISGGSAPAQNSLSSVLSAQRSKDDNVYASLHDKRDAWISSIKSDDPSTLSYTRLEFHPIWQFFNKRSLQKKVYEWVKKNYPDKLEIIKNNKELERELEN